MSHLDPFYLVKDEVQDSISQLRSGMGEWIKLPQVSNERATLMKKLMSSCDTIKWQLDELEKAIAIAERDPVKFGVNTRELQERKAWTNLQSSEVSGFRKTLQVADDALRLPLAAPLRDVHRDPSKRNRQASQNEEYIQFEQERQTQLIKEQDQDLDDLSQSVERMGNIGMSIHEELSSQEVLINDLGRDIDTASNRLDYVQKKMEKMIKKAGAKGQLVMIVFLVILLAVLVILIFYT